MQTIKFQDKSLLDEATLEQIEEVRENDSLNNSHIAIMKDAHKGVGVNIGFSATLNDGVVDPNIVSSDIACGITIFQLGGWRPTEKDFRWIDDIIRGTQIDQQKRFNIGIVEEITDAHYMRSKDDYRFGNDKNGIFVQRPIYQAWKIMRTLEAKGIIPSDKVDTIMKSFGTIGNGNHFIELLQDERNQAYLAVHSGSRSLGVAVNNYFVKKGFNRDFIKQSDLILKFKQDNPEIKGEKLGEAIKQLREENPVIKQKYPLVDIDEYFEVQQLVYEWAKYSREFMLLLIIGELDLFRNQAIGDNGKVGRKYWDPNFAKSKVELLLNVCHNFLDKHDGTYIVRKGAIPNYQDEWVAIALNQCEGIVIGKGIDNKEMNYTLPHGNGRLFSRRTAFDNFTLEQLKTTLKEHNVYTTTALDSTVDEIMFAYKKTNDVVGDINNYLTKIRWLRPIYNFKVANGWVAR